MTSLQKQLNVLRATRTNELDLRAQKAAYSKSLLFEPSVAATQSLDTVFQICYEGFESLCSLDPRFIQYDRSLFSSHSKSQDRNHLTERENKELDVVLDSFLALVGGRLLLKPAQKSVEWLVRRFRVNELNVESLVLTFLPYHSTPLFLALLAVLPSQLSPTLKFLHRYINSAQNPPRDALVQAMVQNPSFFSAVNQYLLRVSAAGYQHHMLVSLWASLMVQGIDGILNAAKSGREAVQAQKEGDLLLQLLPILSEAMTRKNASEMTLGCYMVIIVLVGKANLRDHVLSALMEAVATNWTEETCAAGLSCLAFLAEQRETTKLSGHVAKAVLKLANLGEHLTALADQQNVQNLTMGLVLFTARKLDDKHMPFLDHMLRHHLLEKDAENAVKIALSDSLQAIRTRKSSLLDLRALDQLERLLGPSHHEAFAESTGSSMQSPVQPQKQDESSDIDQMGAEPRTVPELEDGIGQDIADLVNSASVNSFLEANSEAEFARVFEVYERTLSFPNYRDALFRSPYFTGKSRLETFLVRVWCTSLSTTARFSALTYAAETLGNKSFHSFQQASWLVPYLLVALSDHNRKVRSACVKFVKAIAASSSEWPKSLDIELLDLEKSRLYGISQMKITWPSAKELESFLKCYLVPRLEECVSDAAHILSVLRDSFGSPQSILTDEPSRKGKTLKAVQKSSLFAAFCGHAACVQVIPLKIALLHSLNVVGKVAGQPRSKFLAPLMSEFIYQRSKMGDADHGNRELLSRYEAAIIAVVHPGDDDALAVLMELATEEASEVGTDLPTRAMSRFVKLWPLIRRGNQSSLAMSLFRQGTSQATEAVGVTKRKRSVTLLKSVDLHSDTLISILEEVVNNHAGDGPAAKKQRTSLGPVESLEGNNGEDTSLIKLTLILEVAESSMPKPSVEIFHALCKALQQTQKMSLRLGTELSYLVSVTLGLMASTMQALSTEELMKKIDTSIVRTDSLVDCACKTSSPQARSSALLLLSAMAKRSPQVVLHSVIPIFTMISSTTARQSDDFSAHVVDQTIQDVIPMLAKKLREQRKDLVSSTAEILLSFATAFEHIPPHRRLHLFSLLASSLGPEQSLFALIAVLTDSFPDNLDVAQFASTLFTSFGTMVSMTTILKCLDLVIDGLKEQPGLFHTLCRQGSSVAPRDEATLQHMQMLSTLLRDVKFKSGIRRDLKDIAFAQDLRETFVCSFERIFQISQSTKGSVQAHVSTLMQNLLAVFPFEEMSMALERLFSSHDRELCKAVLQTLQTRMRSLKHAEKESKVAIVSLLGHLTSALMAPDNDALKPNIMACLDCICERFGKADPTSTLRAMQVITESGCLRSQDSLLRVLSLNCVGSAVEVLGNEFIPLLPSSQDAAIHGLQDSLVEGKVDERLHNASFAFFNALEDHLPFVVPQKTLGSVLNLSAVSAGLGVGGGAAAAQNRFQFSRLVATRAELGTSVQSFNEIWDTVLASGPQAVKEYLAMVKLTIESQTKASVSRSTKTMFTLAFNILDLRHKAHGSEAYTVAGVDDLEHAAIETFLAFVLKINDAVFRPFFLQLVDWASREGKSLRTLVLFRVVLTLSEKLKSIFTSYMGNLIERASEVLQDKSEDKSTQTLKTSVLHALMSSFKHDQDEFWQAPARFDAILEPLISQLSLASLAKSRSEVIPAITELAAVVGSSENHRTMNGILLKHLRSEHARTRLATIYCQQSLAERLGDDWLGHLPEMLPLINELQEDDDETVERETHKWIKMIEEILGESLTAMLQ